MKPPLLIFLCSFLLITNSFAQVSTSHNEFNVIFYNVENLFDTLNDPKTADDEFLYHGSRRWTKRRFQKKILNISKVILSSCNFQMPDIIGLCEVENRFVLEELTRKTPLQKFNFQIIHKDSPDPRGIDVALLYRTDQCRPLYYEYIPLKDDAGETIRSREILYACFELLPKDTLHLFFNHWPSRYGGQSETEHKRIKAARQLRDKIDELQQKHKSPKILLMGDFNDTPNNKSISEILKTTTRSNRSNAYELINLSAKWKTNKGTLKYRQSWLVFDQILVTDNLLTSKRKWHTKPDDAQIIMLDYLLEDDPKFLGKRLFRTYYGMKYHGGFSDHLPIRLKLLYLD